VNLPPAKWFATPKDHPLPVQMQEFMNLLIGKYQWTGFKPAHWSFPDNQIALKESNCISV